MPRSRAAYNLRAVSWRTCQRRALATDALTQARADRRTIAIRLTAIAAEIRILARTQTSATALNSGTVNWSSFERGLPNAVTANYTTPVGRLWIAEEWWERKPVDVRRSILRDSFAIEVLQGGRGARRVIVTTR